MNVIVTTPSVPYTIKQDGESDRVISCVSEWPKTLAKGAKVDVYEPIVLVTIVTPQTYYGDMIEVIKEKRGDSIETRYGVYINAYLVYKYSISAILNYYINFPHTL